MFKRHWVELATNRDAIPLDPFWQQYFDLDLMGVLRVLTVRVDGLLVGYVFVALAPHTHYASTLWANYDMFWLDPVYRQGWTGVKMLLEAERQMREWGAKAISLSMKIAFNEAYEGRMHRLLVRLGYAPRDVVYVKVL